MSETKLKTEPAMMDKQERSKTRKTIVVQDPLPTRKELLEFDLRKLKSDSQKAKNHLEFHQKKIATYKKLEKRLKSVIEDKDGALNTHKPPHQKTSGFREWTEQNVNLCTGCLNDCIYCYAKALAYRRKQVEPGHWQEQIIRQKEVDAPRKLYSGRVGFPSTHDINDSNIEACLTVLGKLLRAGNEVLIVSKPRLECIKRICSVSEFFKNEIMFRFTIGATDDNILTFWEPGAPAYAERKEALKYAYDQGFQTSVSVEPMLDSPNIDFLINDLIPYASDSIWIGTMNHLGNLKKQGDENIKNAVSTIEANQSPEILIEIYNRFRNNDKIKWKSSIKKIVGL